MAILTQSQYAKARGLTKQAVSLAVKVGRLPLVDGKVDSDVADAVFATSVMAETLPSFAEARAAKEAFQARLKRLEYERRRGDLVSIRDVDAYVSSMIFTARSVLWEIPSDLADQLSRETNAQVIEALLRKHIGRALGQLSTYRPDFDVNEKTA